jgi:ribosome-associated heat shock protein Hsp15
MRIDKLLWFLRFVRTRSLSQQWVEDGHIRRNGQRVTRCGQPILTGDILTLPWHETVIVIEVTALPARRGPASEAQGCYRVLDGGKSLSQSAAKSSVPEREEQP